MTNFDQHGISDVPSDENILDRLIRVFFEVVEQILRTRSDRIEENHRENVVLLEIRRSNW